MNAVAEVIEHLEKSMEHLDKACAILEDHANKPKNNNTIYADQFDFESYQIYKSMLNIKDIQNKYGVA